MSCHRVERNTNMYMNKSFYLPAPHTVYKIMTKYM